MAGSCGVTPSCSNVTVESCSDVRVGNTAEDGLSMDFKDLQMALNFVAHSTEEGACFSVEVASGNYTLNQPVTINSSIILHGDNSAPVVVTVDLDQNFSSAEMPLYPLLFQGVDCVDIANIHFEHSPGTLGFDNVAKVVINGSSFRLGRSLHVSVWVCLCK